MYAQQIFENFYIPYYNFMACIFNATNLLIIIYDIYFYIKII